MKLSLSYLVSFLLISILASCKGINFNDVQNPPQSTNGEKTEKIIDENFYIRRTNEDVLSFVKRVGDASYVSGNYKIGHRVIETKEWLNDIITIIVFFDIYYPDEDSENVEGHVYFSFDEKKYYSIGIDTFYPEGRKATIEYVFFENVDEDSEKELVILCSWEQQIKGFTEGKLYQPFFYDDFYPEAGINTLNKIKELNDFFDIEFEGTREGKEFVAKYNSTDKIKAALKVIK